MSPAGFVTLREQFYCLRGYPPPQNKLPKLQRTVLWSSLLDLKINLNFSFINKNFFCKIKILSLLFSSFFFSREIYNNIEHLRVTNSEGGGANSHLDMFFTDRSFLIHKLIILFSYQFWSADLDKKETIRAVAGQRSSPELRIVSKTKKFFESKK